MTIDISIGDILGKKHIVIYRLPRKHDYASFRKKWLLLIVPSMNKNASAKDGILRGLGGWQSSNATTKNFE